MFRCYTMVKNHTGAFVTLMWVGVQNQNATELQINDSVIDINPFGLKWWQNSVVSFNLLCLWQIMLSEAVCQPEYHHLSVHLSSRWVRSITLPMHSGLSLSWRRRWNVCTLASTSPRQAQLQCWAVILITQTSKIPFSPVEFHCCCEEHRLQFLSVGKQPEIWFL